MPLSNNEPREIQRTPGRTGNHIHRRKPLKIDWFNSTGPKLIYPITAHKTYLITFKNNLLIHILQFSTWTLQIGEKSKRKITLYCYHQNWYRNFGKGYRTHPFGSTRNMCNLCTYTRRGAKLTRSTTDESYDGRYHQK